MTSKYARPVRARRIKAKLMWQAQDAWGEICDWKGDAGRIAHDGRFVEPKPVYVLAADDEHRLVEQATDAIDFGATPKENARAVLSSLGLLKRGRRK